MCKEVQEHVIKSMIKSHGPVEKFNGFVGTAQIARDMREVCMAKRIIWIEAYRLLMLAFRSVLIPRPHMEPAESKVCHWLGIVERDGFVRVLNAQVV